MTEPHRTPERGCLVSSFQASSFHCSPRQGSAALVGRVAPSWEREKGLQHEARLCLAIGLVCTTKSPPVAQALAQDSRSVDSKAAWSWPAPHEAGPMRPWAHLIRATRAVVSLASFAARALPEDNQAFPAHTLASCVLCGH